MNVACPLSYQPVDSYPCQYTYPYLYAFIFQLRASSATSKGKENTRSSPLLQSVSPAASIRFKCLSPRLNIMLTMKQLTIVSPPFLFHFFTIHHHSLSFFFNYSFSSLFPPLSLSLSLSLFISPPLPPPPPLKRVGVHAVVKVARWPPQ